jgi:hypothetical protein
VRSIIADHERSGRTFNTMERALLDEFALLVIRARELRAQGRLGELTEVVRLMARIGANLGVDRNNSRRNNAKPLPERAYADLGEDDE